MVAACQEDMWYHMAQVRETGLAPTLHNASSKLYFVFGKKFQETFFPTTKREQKKRDYHNKNSLVQA